MVWPTEVLTLFRRNNTRSFKYYSGATTDSRFGRTYVNFVQTPDSDEVSNSNRIYSTIPRASPVKKHHIGPVIFSPESLLARSKSTPLLVLRARSINLA